MSLLRKVPPLDSRALPSQYGPEYYSQHFDPPYRRENSHWLDFFGRIADELVRQLNPRRVLDVGCAKGFLVECLRDRGVEAYGLDISEHAISEVRPDIRAYCWVGSASEPMDGHYDLITCIEVCEHLSEAQAGMAIRNMTSRANTILFSSTPGDFAEPTHVNVRPILYWLKLFRNASFAPDADFQADFVAPQAMLLRRVSLCPPEETLRLVARSRDQAVELAQTRNQLARLQVELEGLRAELSDSARKAESICQIQRRQLENINAELLALKEELAATSAIRSLQAKEIAVQLEELSGASLKFEEMQAELAAKDTALHAVLNSRGWTLLNRYRSFRNRLMQHAPVQRMARAVRRRAPSVRDANLRYQQWIEKYEQPSRNLGEIYGTMAAFSYKPKISIVIPVHNPPEKFLDLAIRSMQSQYYENWELCICDDASTSIHVPQYLEEQRHRDNRIKVTYSPCNEGISGASNRALRLASGEFVGFLDHDDELSHNALYEVVKLLQQYRDADMIYSDEDKLGSDGTRQDPFFKPDWSPEYLLSCMYTCHFSVYRRALLESLGGLRQGFEGSQDYDLVLRLAEKTGKIHHISKVLYHWRTVPGSVAGWSGAKPYAYAAARKALAEHLSRRGLQGSVLDGKWHGHYRVKFPVQGTANVSIIIPTRNKAALLKRCVRSIESKASYPHYEILIVDNQSSEPDAQRYLSRLRHRVVSFTEPFNYSRVINFGARHAHGDFLLFLNNDTEVISPDWLSDMLGLCQQREIGVVGAKLLFPDHRIQHAGVVLGVGGVAGHVLKGFPRNAKNHFGIAGDVRNYSAVTGACMMVRKEVFEQVGGFDETLPIAFNDVDFCLRVRQAGYRIVCTPYAELYHVESASRGYDLATQDIARMQSRWGKLLMNDPYYNPNLTLEREDFAVRT